MKQEKEINVNYTKQVREYCIKYSKGLIYISIIHNTAC